MLMFDKKKEGLKQAYLSTLDNTTTVFQFWFYSSVHLLAWKGIKYSRTEDKTKMMMGESFISHITIKQSFEC